MIGQIFQPSSAGGNNYDLVSQGAASSDYLPVNLFSELDYGESALLTFKYLDLVSLTNWDYATISGKVSL